MDSETQPVQNISASTYEYILNHYLWAILLWSGVTIVLLVLLKAPQVIFFALGIAFVGYAYVYSKMKSEFTKQFGASIGFTYSKEAPLDTVSGVMFSMGHGASISDVLAGSYQNIPMRIFTYIFTVGSGKNSHTYNYTVFESTFNNELPAIHLDSSANRFSVPYEFGTGESIKLEGDFNKYFSLHVPKGYEMEAYQIFTPDVMVQLIDKAKGLDFEFNGNRLYIYSPKIISKRDKMQAMFDLVDYLVALMSKNISAVDK